MDIKVYQNAIIVTALLLMVLSFMWFGDLSLKEVLQIRLDSICFSLDSICF